VFGDFLSTTVADPGHRAEKDQYMTIAWSKSLRWVTGAHKERGDRIRIISARTLTRNERRA
jgi:uncharacterized protein